MKYREGRNFLKKGGVSGKLKIIEFGEVDFKKGPHFFFFFLFNLSPTLPIIFLFLFYLRHKKESYSYSITV